MSAPTTLREATQLLDDLTDTLRHLLNQNSPSTSGSEDLQLAQKLAVELAKSGWVTEYPEES